MNVGGQGARGHKLLIDRNADVNETRGIVWDAKAQGGKSGVWILGGGSRRRTILLQTEPQIQEVLGDRREGARLLPRRSPDAASRYRRACRARRRPEAVSWGKIDPDQLPGTVICYADATIGLPLLTAYALAKHKPRERRRLYDRRGELMERLKKAYFESGRAAEAAPRK
jgi:deoxyhypusine synthase